MYSPQKLHPVAYLGSIVNGVRNLWIPLIIILFNSRDVIFSGEISLKYILIFISILILVIVLFGGMDFLNKYRTRFWIEAGKFIYKDGVITNREKELDIGRIQSIDFSEPIFHRMFGAVKLEIITPGDAIRIDTMKKTQAESLQRILYDEKSQAEGEAIIGASSGWPRQEAEEEPQEFTTLYLMSNRSLLLMSMTSGALGTFLALAFGFINIIGADFLLERYFDYFEGAFQSVLWAYMLAVGSFILVGYAIGILILMIKYYKYTLKMKDDDLVVEYGLIEKKHQSININRVQNIIIRDSILRRMIGYYSLAATITSDSLEGDDVEGKVEILPFIKRDDLYRITKEIFPNYHIEVPPRIVPVRGYRRYFQVMALGIFTVSAIIQYFWFDYMWAIGLALLTIVALSGFYSAYNSGYTIRDEEINLMTTSFFKRSHYIIKSEKLIEAEWAYNPFLKRSELGIITLVTAAGMMGSRATLKFIDQKDVDTIWQWAERSASNEKDITEIDHGVADS
ncbi:PH domain-containing protein [Salinicoccus jeotgali]|uniref:PH domain-containing protein n=1 Tax=Salinicoccus jeotgali TaxID=381634 RepID=A0ABP7E9X0_9STAP